MHESHFPHLHFPESLVYAVDLIDDRFFLSTFFLSNLFLCSVTCRTTILVILNSLLLQLKAYKQHRDSVSSRGLESMRKAIDVPLQIYIQLS
jgi:hypothetical protein